MWHSGVATTRGITSRFGASMTLCGRSSDHLLGRLFLLVVDRITPELVSVNEIIEDDDEFSHRGCDYHFFGFFFCDQSDVEGLKRRIEPNCDEFRYVESSADVVATTGYFSFAD